MVWSLGVTLFVVFIVLLLLVFNVSQQMILFCRKPGVKLFQLRLLFIPYFIQFLGTAALTDWGMFLRKVSWLSLGFSVLLFVVWWLLRAGGMI